MNITVGWTQIKEYADLKSLSIQYVDYNGNYYLSVIEGAFTLETILSQEDPSNADLIDFEDNYKADGNQTVATPIIRNTEVTGTIESNNEYVEIDCNGLATIFVEITGTWTGQIGFWQSFDGVFNNMTALWGVNYSLLDNVVINSAEVNGIYAFPVAGIKLARIVSGGLDAPATIRIIGSHASIINTTVLTLPIQYVYPKGEYNATPPTLGDTDVAMLQLDSQGNLKTTASIALDSLDLTNSDPITVAIVDGSGDQITTFGGGSQYTEGDTDASITGTVAMMEVGSNTLQPVQGTVADGLLVNLGSNNDVTVTGVATETTLSSINDKLAIIDAFSTRTETFTTNTTGTTVDVSTGPLRDFTVQCTATGSVTSWTIVLEGSLNNSNFTTIATHTNVIGTGVLVFASDSPVLYYRLNCTALVLGAGTNVVAKALGMR